MDETLVYIDFNNLMAINELSDPEMSIKIIGIDQSDVLMLINQKLLRGKYDILLGTHLFFEENVDADNHNKSCTSPTKDVYEYHSKSNKALNVRRVFVEPSKSTDFEHTSTDSEDFRSRLSVKITYPQALNMMLPLESSAPRQIDEDDTYVFRNCIIRTSVEGTKETDKEVD